MTDSTPTASASEDHSERCPKCGVIGELVTAEGDVLVFACPLNGKHDDCRRLRAVTVRWDFYDPERGERGYYDDEGHWWPVAHPDAWQEPQEGDDR